MVDQQAKISLPAVILALIEALSNTRNEYSFHAAELEDAEAAFKRVDEELRRLQARIAEREAELASSGAATPEEPFEEDAQIVRVERQKRIASLRVAAPRDRLAACTADMQRLTAEIKTAWLEFGKHEYSQVLAAFNETAIALRERFANLCAVAAVFRSLKFAIPEVVVEDISNHGVFISTTDAVWVSRYQPERRELYAALTALGSEVEQAIRPSDRGGKEE